VIGGETGSGLAEFAMQLPSDRFPHPSGNTHTVAARFLRPQNQPVARD
jgi:hypothetical protein